MAANTGQLSEDPAVVELFVAAPISSTRPTGQFLVDAQRLLTVLSHYVICSNPAT